MDGAGNTYKYNKEEIIEKGLSLDNTKAFEASAQVIEAITNAPVHRVYKKTQNINQALDERNEAWQRFWMMLGWSPWDVGVDIREREKEDKETVKDTYDPFGRGGGGKKKKKKKTKKKTEKVYDPFGR